MNRIFLFGLSAAVCLTGSVVMAGSRSSAGSSWAPHVSAGVMSAPHISGGTASFQRISTASATMPRTGSVTTNHLSGNNNNCHHHHHHRCVVFIDTFGFPYWYPYGYYDYNPVVYTDDGSLVAEVQQRLARAGYYYGPIDGILGPRTQAAIRAYERAHNLRVDGMISQGLVATMALR